MPQCAVVFCLNLLFLPCGRMLRRWWGVCRVAMGKQKLLLGAVRELCRNALEPFYCGWLPPPELSVRHGILGSPVLHIPQFDLMAPSL